MLPRSRPPYPVPNPRMTNGMFNRGGGPSMYGMGAGMRPQMRMRPGMNSPMGMGQGMRAPQGKKGGGLLSKLLGRGGAQDAGAGTFSSYPARAVTGPTAAKTGGGFLKTLTDPAALNGFLTNTQKVLNSAQQIGPMVQQYGPLVRNIPSLWKLYKGLKDVPSDSESEESNEKAGLEDESAPEQKKKTKKKMKSQDTEKKATETKPQKGESVPKLYI